MDMQKRFRLLIIIVLSSIVLKGQVRVYSNELLNIGVDAGALSMGNSVVAITQGVNAAYWNPAGIYRSGKQMEVSLMHSNYFSGLAQYDYAAASYKINDSAAVSFSFIRFGVDDIPNTLNLIDANGNVNYDRISYFSVADYAFLFSYSRSLKIKGLSVGGSLKIIYRSQSDFAKAYGFGFDFGAQYLYNKWRFGTLLRDATSTFNIWIFNKELFEQTFIQTGNEVPENSMELTLPKLLLAGARNFKINNQINALVEIDLDVYFDGAHNSLIKFDPVSIEPHLGFRFSYLKNVFISGGITGFQITKDINQENQFMMQPTIGVGFSYFNIRFDYALTDVGDLSIAPYSHIFSLKYSFDFKK